MSRLLSTTLEARQGPVIYLFDMWVDQQKHFGLNKEVLAACDRPEDYQGDRSMFTGRVARVLQRQNGAAITMSHFHQKSVELYDVKDSDETQNPWPIHVELHKKQADSITLAALPDYPPPTCTEMPLDTDAEVPLLTDLSPRFLAQVYTTDLTPPSLKQWRQWVNKLRPAYISENDVQLSGCYQSDDITLIHFVVPIALWNLLNRRGRGYSAADLPPGPKSWLAVFPTEQSDPHEP